MTTANNKANTTPSTGQVADSILQLECDLVEIARCDLGLAEVQALRIAKALVGGLRKRYGGLRIGGRGAAVYIPAPSKVERNAAIRREFNGVNHKEVMERHGIRRAQLYRIVSANPRTARIGVASAKVPRDL